MAHPAQGWVSKGARTQPKGPTLRQQADAHRATKGTREERSAGLIARARNTTEQRNDALGYEQVTKRELERERSLNPRSRAAKNAVYAQEKVVSQAAHKASEASVRLKRLEFRAGNYKPTSKGERTALDYGRDFNRLKSSAREAKVTASVNRDQPAKRRAALNAAVKYRRASMNTAGAKRRIAEQAARAVSREPARFPLFAR